MRLVAKGQREKGIGVMSLLGLFLVVALIVALLPAQGALGATPQPIEGDWEWLGTPIRVTVTGPNTYTGVLLTRGTAEALPCFEVGDIVWYLNGESNSALLYTGTTPWADINDCTPLGPGYSTWTLSSETQGGYCTTDPTGERGTVCWPITKVNARRYEIRYMAFIPANYTSIPSPEVTCPTLVRRPNGSTEIQVWALIFDADDRSFDASAFDRGSYRVAVTATVLEKTDPGGNVTFELAPEPEPTRITASRSYVGDRKAGKKSALHHGVRQRIDPSDDDGILHDCSLLHDEAPGELLEQLDPRISVTGRQSVTVEFGGKGRVGLARLLVPSIDWHLAVVIDTSGPQPTARVVGVHDEFPAHELYVNSALIHCHSPISNCQSRGGRRRLPVRSFDLLDPLLGLNTLMEVNTAPMLVEPLE